jgi:integrase
LSSVSSVGYDDEMVIVQDVPGFIELLRERNHGRQLIVPAMVSLFTGMRLGEMLALRWGRVDLDRKIIEVREALEETKAYGIRFKAPKSKAGRRDITLPDLLLETLRDFRKEQLELRVKLGAGRLADDGDMGVDVVTISKRLGHSKPDITLRIYADQRGVKAQIRPKLSFRSICVPT